MDHLTLNREATRTQPRRLLFIGEHWNGSSARSLSNALSALPEIELDDIGEDLYSPRGRSLITRAINRVMRRIYQSDLKKEIFQRIRGFKPHVVVVYKGNLVPASVVREIQKAGIPIVNVYPDCSPHAFGSQLQKAMGAYDLVISTKPFHPEHWNTTYGYQNPCVFVPHGFDPAVHLWSNPPGSHDFDVVLAASWRPQYEHIMREFARVPGIADLRVALAGNGWSMRRHKLPSTWEFPGHLSGRAYGEFIRRGKIVVAPVHTELIVRGQRQPGDEDTTRTYELAAAHCFFLHRRTRYAQSLFDESKEVPLWSDGKELGELVLRYLPLEEERRQMARAVHLRAASSHSIRARANAVSAHISSLLDKYEGEHPKAQIAAGSTSVAQG